MDIFYHYTTREAFLNIIQNKKIWATDILYLNDSEEINYTFKLFQSILQKYLKDYSNKNSKEFNYLKDCCKTYDVLNDIYQEWSNFVVSFSTKKDLLSQWRGYSNEKGGICIGFNGEYLHALAENHGYKIGICNYDELQQEIELNAIIDESISKIKKIENLDENIIDEEVISLYEALLDLAPKFKHPSFKEEKECRIIIDRENVKKSLVKYRSSTSMLIPFYEIDLRPNNIIIKIDEVIVGPTPHPELSYASVEKFLKQQDPQNIKYEKLFISDIPYRTW